MDRQNDVDKKIETVFSSLPFPGEDKEQIMLYLSQQNLTEKIMNAVYKEKHKNIKTAFWAICLVLQLLIIISIGGEKVKAAAFIFQFEIYSLIFFLFLGLSVFATLIGFIFSLHLQPLKQYFRHHEV